MSSWSITALQAWFSTDQKVYPLKTENEGPRTRGTASLSAPCGPRRAGPGLGTLSAHCLAGPCPLSFCACLWELFLSGSGRKSPHVAPCGPKSRRHVSPNGFSSNENIPSRQCALNDHVKGQSVSSLTDRWHFGEIFKSSKSVRDEFGGLGGTVFRTEKKALRANGLN